MASVSWSHDLFTLQTKNFSYNTGKCENDLFNFVCQADLSVEIVSY